jgi:hypothetical protein
MLIAKMTINTVVIDEYALPALDSALIEDSWFGMFNLPKNVEGIRRVLVGSTVYLLSPRATLDSGYLVVLVDKDGVFSSTAKPRNVFERIIRVALSQFDRSISVPIPWQKFHAGSRVSIYAESYLRKNENRICFDRAPNGNENIYAFAVTEKAQDLENVPLDLVSYTVAIDSMLDALTTQSIEIVDGGNFGIVLNESLRVHNATPGTLDEWYEKRLNREQRKFVEQPGDGPVRLRGAAGTGKTQAMVVKLLRDVYIDADANSEKRFAFLTHSSALAHEIVRGMLYALDPSERWARLKNNDGSPKIWIGTLYELAQAQLGYEKKGLRPLSLDGTEGRDYQRILIASALDAVKTDPRISLGLLKECPELASRILDNKCHDALIEELMNEFACSLDSDNIRKGSPEADRYIRASRENWQMNLETLNSRKLVLEIHDKYRSLLHSEKFLSMDQMIADFGRYLSTHEWEQLRERDGFDYIFVDEYHYFTRVEAMILQNLFKPRAGISGRWPLFMAYDLKQSTRDVALGSGVSRFRNPGVGESTKVELKTVYRSTPEIAAFLRDLDGSFPAIDLEGEFDTYLGNSEQPHGETPILQIFETDAMLVDSIFIQATAKARTLPEKGSQVAVLCMNERLFELYRNAGRINDKFIAITSREDFRELRYAKNRCIFSMPEYVAGLQFNTVFVIHCDDVDLTVEHTSQGARRRYVSRMYLGASRAMHNLTIASSSERGGASAVLTAPLKANNLIKQDY